MTTKETRKRGKAIWKVSVQRSSGTWIHKNISNATRDEAIDAMIEHLRSKGIGKKNPSKAEIRMITATLISA